MHLILSAAKDADCLISVSGRLDGELIEMKCEFRDSTLVSTETDAVIYEIFQLLRKIATNKDNVVSFTANIPTTR